MAETPALGQPCPSSWHPQRRPRSGLDLAQGSHLLWTRNPAPRLRARSPGIRPLPCPLIRPPPRATPARPSSAPPLEAWKTPRPVLPFLAGGRVLSRLLSCQAAHPHSAPTPNQTREPQLPPQSPPSPLRSPAPFLGLQDCGGGDRTPFRWSYSTSPTFARAGLWASSPPSQARERPYLAPFLPYLSLPHNY